MSETRLVNSARQRRIEWVLWALSGTICVVVLVLIAGPRPPGTAGTLDVSQLPTLNASLNALAACLLVAGALAIKQGRFMLHKRLMVGAFSASTLFLVSYVVYHWFSPGPVRYTGNYRAVYLGILISHIALSVVVLPLALITLFRGLAGAIAKHRAWAPTTLGLWLYVSVTGVLVYWMAHAQ